MVTYTYSFLFCWCFCSLFLFSFLTSFVGLSHSELFETQKKTVFSRVLHLRYVQEPSTLLLPLAFIIVLERFLLRYQKRLKIMPKVLIKSKQVNFCQKSRTISIFDEFCLNCLRILNIIVIYIFSLMASPCYLVPKWARSRSITCSQARYLKTV